MAMKQVNGRKICDCREAAKILGVTMGRVRQMAREKRVWSEHVTDRALVFDKAEIKKVSVERARARAAGKVSGPAPGGFRPDD